MENLPGFDLPDRVAMFCLPLGAVIESWPADAHHPSPVFSTFVLTAAAADNDRVYGAAVTFYDPMDASLLSDVQRSQLLLDEPQSSSSTQKRVIAQNKSLCLLSRSPFFSTFKQFLIYLYKMSRPMSPPHSAPIERFFSITSYFVI
jgi:DENN domain-containing protein 4